MSSKTGTVRALAKPAATAVIGMTTVPITVEIFRRILSSGVRVEFIILRLIVFFVFFSENLIVFDFNGALSFICK